MKLIGTSRSVRSHWSLCFQPVRTDWLLGWWNERISQEAEFLTQPPALPPPWLQSNRNPLISVQERSICLQLEQRIYRNWKCANFRSLKSLPAVSHFIQRRNLSSKRWCAEERNYIRRKAADITVWYCYLFANYLNTFQGLDVFKWCNELVRTY